VNQLGTQRQRLADLAARERDELASEIHLAAEVQQSILPRSVPTRYTSGRTTSLSRKSRPLSYHFHPVTKSEHGQRNMTSVFGGCGRILQCHANVERAAFSRAGETLAARVFFKS
jgi:hypothetical protein